MGEFVIGDEKLGVLFMICEASRFLSVHEVYRIPKDQSRNASSSEVIRALEQTWVQRHGLMNVLRCDPEGAGPHGRNFSHG